MQSQSKWLQRHGAHVARFTYQCFGFGFYILTWELSIRVRQLIPISASFPIRTKVKRALLRQLSKWFLELCSWSSLLTKIKPGNLFKKYKIWSCIEMFLVNHIEVNYTKNESLPLNISLVRFFIWFLREVCHSGGWLCAIKSLICQKKFWFFILGMALSNRPLYQKDQMPANNILAFLSTRHGTVIYALMEKQKPYC